MMLTVVGKNLEKFGNPASPEKRRDREEERREYILSADADHRRLFDVGPKEVLSRGPRQAHSGKRARRAVWERRENKALQRL
jgi:hypothetical protein